MYDAIEYAQYKAQRIKDLTPSSNSFNIKILDFGCGLGLMTYYLQEVFFEARVVGVDQSKEKIAQAKKEYAEIEFQIIKDNTLSFSDNYFDVVVVADTFHHIPIAMHHHWVQELMRVLKVSGYIIFLELNPWNYGVKKDFYLNPEEKNSIMISPQYARNLFKSFGKIRFYFYQFFSKRLSILVFLEPYLVKIPLGGFYLIMIKKN